VKLLASPFVTFRLKDSDKTTRNISPFYIRKAVGSVAGKVTCASRLKKGALLMAARNGKQVAVVLEANLLESHPVLLARHPQTFSWERCHSHPCCRWYVGRRDPVCPC
jgi:hypothetical protein